MITQDQVKDLVTRIDPLKGYLSIDEKLIQLEEEDQKTLDPNFWDNPKEAEKQLKVVRNIKVWYCMPQVVIACTVAI